MLPAIDNNDKDEKKVVKPEITVREPWDSAFTRFVAPFIAAVRYVPLALEEINPYDFLHKKDSLIKEGKILAEGKGAAWVEPKPSTTKLGAVGRYVSRNFAAFGIGTIIAAAIGFYSKNTLHDIKSLYSEAMGYELDKKPEDVTLGDIFMKSQNTALAVTRSAFINRTLMRAAAAATFFVPWQKFRGYKELQPEFGANANMGVGVVGSYMLAESLFREKSFFDAEQGLVANTIQHSNANPNQSVTSMDIKGLLLLQRKHLNKDYQWPAGTSQEGKEQLLLAERIAILMNQTYENDPKLEHANFTIGKLNFLIGFGLLEKLPESMAFVELANKSTDMSEVKQARSAIKAGQNPAEVFAQFGVEVKAVSDKKAVAAPQMEMPEKKFADTVQSTHEKSIAHKSLHDYAAHTTQHLAV